MEILKSLKLNDVKFYFDINLEKYTTIKLAKPGSIALVLSEEALSNLLTILKKEKIKYRLVGWGANQVLANTENILFIKLSFPFDRSIISSDKNFFELPASAPLNQLSSIASKLGLSGWEVFTGIPGSLGGAICMNAGTSLGEIGDLIESVRVITIDGLIEKRELNKESFIYRNNLFLKDGEVIVSAVIRHNGIDSSLSEKIEKYLDYRKSTQPLTTKNCGSVFKNNPGFVVGKTVDRVGLKGFGLNTVAVSMMHGNFIENYDNASTEEFEQLIQALKDEIERYSGQVFELEVKIY